jgi:hypothetical protein
MTNAVLEVLTAVTHLLGLPMPDSTSVELGEEHDETSPEYGGDIFTYREHDGTVHRFNLAVDPPHRLDPQGEPRESG